MSCRHIGVFDLTAGNLHIGKQLPIRTPHDANTAEEAINSHLLPALTYHPFGMVRTAESDPRFLKLLPPYVHDSAWSKAPYQLVFSLQGGLAFIEQHKGQPRRQAKANRNDHVDRYSQGGREIMHVIMVAHQRNEPQLPAAPVACSRSFDGAQAAC